MARDPDEEREASPPPPPLLAYTASSQQHKGRKDRPKGGATARSTATRRFQKKAEPVVFDEKARHEFLTGFRKRKQARIETGRKKAEERGREERRKARAATRKARKDQAEENVRMEKIAYGELEDEEADDGADGGEGRRDLSPSAYETEEHHTTVTVQEWDPSMDDEVEEAKARQETADKLKRIQAALPPSSRRIAKKLKSADKAKADVRDISRLMDVDEAPIAPVLPFTDEAKKEGNREEQGEKGKAKKKAKFHYESKLERAKAKAKIKEDRARYAERRKAERLLAAKNSKPGKKAGRGVIRRKK